MRAASGLGVGSRFVHRSGLPSICCSTSQPYCQKQLLVQLVSPKQLRVVQTAHKGQLGMCRCGGICVPGSVRVSKCSCTAVKSFTLVLVCRCPSLAVLLCGKLQRWPYSITQCTTTHVHSILTLCFKFDAQQLQTNNNLRTCLGCSATKSSCIAYMRSFAAGSLGSYVSTAAGRIAVISTAAGVQ
jgi:hypothetical protein